MSKNAKTLKIESITGDIDMDFGRTNYSKEDYINNVGSTIEDAIEFAKDKLADIAIDFSKINKEDVKKIADFLIKTFGTTKPALNKDNAEKFAKALGLNSVLSEGFKEGENIAVKIIGIIKVLTGINQYGFFGTVLATVMGYFYGAPGFIIALVGGWVLLSLFNGILEHFGYEDVDIASVGRYNPKKDSRLNETKIIKMKDLKSYILSEVKRINRIEQLNERKERIYKELKMLNENSINEAANTNLEMKNIFNFLVGDLRKNKLKVAVEYADDGKGKNSGFGDQYDAYVQIHSGGANDYNKRLVLVFSPHIDKEKAQKYISSIINKFEKQYSDLDFKLNGLSYSNNTTLVIQLKPNANRHKGPKLDKFMGLKIHKGENGIDILGGSAFYLGRDDKNTAMSLIKVDNNAKKVYLNRGLYQEIGAGGHKNELIKIAKEFAKKNGYEYVGGNVGGFNFD